MNLSPIVSKHIPEFVNDDYPLFVQFLKTYYKWLDNTQITSIESVVDIDNTLDSFIKYFRNELDVYGIKYQHIDERIYLKHVKQFFLAKGSEAAYWFLFRILFNTESAILRPWDYVFIPSAGKWHQDITVLVNITKGNGNNFVQDKVIVIGNDGKEYTGIVKNVIQIRPTIFELYLDRKLTGDISPYNLVKSPDNSIRGRLEPVISKLVIESPGKDFNIGEVYNIDTYNGFGTKIIIQEVFEDGGIKKADLISFGLGYDTIFNYTLFPLINDERILPEYNLQITNTSGGIPSYLNYKTDDNINELNESGAIAKHNYGITPTEYFVDLTYVGKKLGDLTNSTKSTDDISTAALIKFYIDYSCKYPGYYLDKYNVLGQHVYIQDSYYYQIYSYVTALDKPLKSYRTLVENAIHPIGNKLFGSYNPTNKSNLSLSVVDNIEIIKPDDLIIDYALITDSIALNRLYNLNNELTNISDYYLTIFKSGASAPLATLPINIVNISDTVNKIDINKVFNDSITISENFYYDRLYSDNATITDSIVFNRSYKLNDDSFTAVDNGFSKTLTLIITDTNVVNVSDYIPEPFRGILRYESDQVICSESIEFTINNEIANNIIINTSGAIYYGELYVDQTQQYWDALYTENELIF